MDRLFVAAAGASLRTEDKRKAIEVTALLAEIKRARDRASAKATFTLVDAAAGKSYVGLLAAALVLEPGAQVVAIEREPQRAETAAQAAKTLIDRNIRIAIGDVGDATLWPVTPDLVVALHACGPAADLVIDRAIATNAHRLLVVPCCTGAAIAAMPAAVAAADRTGIPRHAAVRRRYLQAFIDAERTLRLESAGYETEVVELCAPTVTPHNLVWRARRVGEPKRSEAARNRHANLLQQTRSEPDSL